MRTITIWAAVLLSGCTGVGDPTFGVPGGGGGGGSAANTADVGVGGGGGAGGEESSSGGATSSSSGGGGATSSSSSSASSSSSGGGGPVSECDGAERGTPCTEGGGHLCDGVGVCVEYIGVRCQLSDGVHICGDGVTRTKITTDTTVCFGAADEHVYAPPGEWCHVMGSVEPGITL